MKKARPGKPSPPPPTEFELAADRVAKRLAAGLTSATVERLVQAGGDGYEHTETNVQRIVDAPLDRLQKLGLLYDREYDAGTKLRELARAAMVETSSGSVDFDRVGGGRVLGPTAFMSDRVLEARRRWRELMEMIPERSLVWQVLLHGVIREMSLRDLGLAFFGRRDRKEATVAAVAAFRLALAALADVLAAASERRRRKAS